MKTMGKRMAAVLLAVAMVVIFVPVSPAVYAYSATNEIAFGTNQLGYNCNSKYAATVLYGGHEWRVIGYNGSGVASAEGNLTLFASVPRAYSNFAADGNSTNVYSGSALEATVGSIANELTDEEKSAIARRTLVSGGYSIQNTDCIAGDEVKDAVMWPLSTAEVNSVESSLKHVDTLTTWAYYWLRSPGNADNKAAIYSGYYDVTNAEGNEVTRGNSVRPAFNLDLKSVLFISTEGIKDYSGEWQPISDAQSNKWKLTLLDSDHDSFAVDKYNIKYDGETKTATVPYSGALTGKNEYVSAIVVDNNWEIKYYARVAEASSKNNATVTLDLQDVFNRDADDKVYVFSEQYNSDNKTDYASDIINITDRLFDFGLEGNGTAQNPYVISDEQDWESLAGFVDTGLVGSDYHFRLDKDIKVSAMVGNENNPFKGVFDGNGHTLTFNADVDTDYCAPFRYTEGAEFSHLMINGTINTSARYAGGLTAHSTGGITVTDCVSSVTLNSSYEGEGWIGGFVGFSEGSIGFTGDLFDGKIHAPNAYYCAGFAATNGGNISFRCCISDPSEFTYRDFANTNDAFSLSGSYPAAQNSKNFERIKVGYSSSVGAIAYKVITAKDVKLDLGKASESFNTSGIVSYEGYDNAVLYKKTLLVGKKDAETSINLPLPKHTYKVNAGTLTETESGYTLAVPDEDVTVTLVHDWQKHIVKATLIKDGKVYEKCSECSKIRNEKTIPKPATFKLSADSYTYDGKVKKPTVTVTDGTTKLAASQYTVTYKNNKKVGKALVTVTLNGNYSGSKTMTFKINPKGTSLKTLTKASKAVTVKWTKQASKMSSSRITGYQIQLATDSKFTKNKKTVTVKGYSKVSKKVTKLKGSKKYYVRIRTYKTVSGTNYYSPWSKVKTIKTKK